MSGANAGAIVTVPEVAVIDEIKDEIEREEPPKPPDNKPVQ